ncbi:hypothetical protein E2C01_009990 [Portunus trituberculatus]|uniref:Uncharacterized protein n=1 Tax=Portunus trituberculatus TaxID=210409 RepID=A0A5B7D768_PORTR|nr:hypothetical protein [Portunus trituberculatus]
MKAFIPVRLHSQPARPTLHPPPLPRDPGDAGKNTRRSLIPQDLSGSKERRGHYNGAFVGVILGRETRLWQELSRLGGASRCWNASGGTKTAVGRFHLYADHCGALHLETPRAATPQRGCLERTGRDAPPPRCDQLSNQQHPGTYGLHVSRGMGVTLASHD